MNKLIFPTEKMRNEPVWSFQLFPNSIASSSPKISFYVQTEAIVSLFGPTVWSLCYRDKSNGLLV